MTPFKCLIVEGTSGVGKSTLIDALLRHHATIAEPRRIRTLVHLAQSHTYGPLAGREDAGTLTVEQNQRHLERIVGMIEWLHASVQEHAKPWCFTVIDTLHLTHCVRPGVTKWQDVSAFDRRLATLGCKLLFLRAAPQTIWEQGIKRRADQQFIREYPKKFGAKLEEIHQYLVREQETLTDLFERSEMPKLLLEKDVAPNDEVATVYRFWSNGTSVKAARSS
jgi:hypothetical protein